jgi:hypothetical protein
VTATRFVPRFGQYANHAKKDANWGVPFAYLAYFAVESPCFASRVTPGPLCPGGEDPCEAKPIPRSGRPRARLCKTNPIPGCAERDEARGEGDVGADYATSPRCPASGNKAKLGQDGTSGGWRAREGPIMQNEPNLPIRARVGTGRGTSLARPSLALIAPNKPNLPSSKTNGKCFEEKDLWSFVPTRGLGKTKPILRLRIADLGLRIVRNKPNSCHYADPEIGVPGSAIMRNKAKLGRAGASGRRGVREGIRATTPRCPASGNKANFGRSLKCRAPSAKRIVQNKANCRRSEERTIWL